MLVSHRGWGDCSHPKLGSAASGPAVLARVLTPMAVVSQCYWN